LKKLVYEKSYLGEHAYRALRAMEKVAKITCSDYADFDKEKDYQLHADFDGFCVAVDYRPYEFAYVCTFERTPNY